MAIQHRDITEADLHEPKGVSVAPVHTIYQSTGTGSGVWSKINTDNITGLEGAAQGNKVVVGAGKTITSVVDFGLGSMVITNNTTPFAVTAAVDPTLNTNSDYKLMSGTGMPFTGMSYNSGVTFSPDRLTVATSGLYRLDIWCDVTAFPTNNSILAMKFRVSGGAFGERRLQRKSNSAGDSGSLSGFSFVTLNEDDYLQLYLASTVSGNVTINSMNFTATLIKAS